MITIIKIVYFVLLFFLAQSQILAQDVEMCGEVFSDSLERLPNSTIKCLNLSTGLILKYMQTGQSNRFCLAIPSDLFKDTLILYISHLGYFSDSLILSSLPDNLKLFKKFKLHRNFQNLEDIVVNAPSTWKRGDTTFFKADRYKSGGENKLVELIENIPGFKINKSGLLTFNNRVVEKILLDGEELFADQIQLLLQQVPIMGIDIIQALENQEDNSVLKSMGKGSSTFINLTFKKKDNTLIFGDFEVGGNTNPGIKLSQTMFSLRRNLSFGVINYFNTTNDYSINTYESQHTPIPLKSNILKLIPTEKFIYAQGIPGSKFLNTQLIQSQVQANFNYGRFAKAQLEVGVIRNKISQNSNSISELLNNGILLKRSEESESDNTPSLVVVRKSVSITKDSTSEIFFQFKGFINRSKGSFKTLYSDSSTVFDESNIVKNRMNYLTLNFRGSKRLTGRNAIVTEMEYSYNRLNQDAASLSDKWRQLFGTLPLDYNGMFYDENKEVTTFKLSINYFKRMSGASRVHRITIDHSNAKLGSLIVFNNSDRQLVDINNSDLSGSGFYSLTKIFSSILVAKEFHGREYSVLGDIGMFKLSRKELLRNKDRLALLVDAKLTSLKQYSDRVFDILTIKYSNSPIALYQFNRAVLPSAMNEFYKNSSDRIEIRSLIASYRLTTRIKKYTSLSIGILASGNFNINASNVKYNYILATRTDSITAKSAWSMSINPELRFPSVFLMGKVKIELNLSRSNAFFAADGKFLKSVFQLFELSMEYSRKLGTGSFLTLNSVINRSVNTIDLMSGKSRLKVDAVSEKSTWRQVIFKRASMNFDLLLYLNNAFTRNQNNNIFLDASLDYYSKNKKWNFLIKLNNITGQKFYYNTINDEPPNRNFLVLPVIRRNLYCGLRFEF